MQLRETGQQHRLVFRRNTRFSQQHFLFRYSLKASSCAVKLVTQHGFLGENGFFHFCDENEPVVLPNATTKLCSELGIASQVNFENRLSELLRCSTTKEPGKRWTCCFVTFVACRRVFTNPKWSLGLQHEKRKQQTRCEPANPVLDRTSRRMSLFLGFALFFHSKPVAPRAPPSKTSPIGTLVGPNRAP